jgi:hypothetical protein
MGAILVVLGCECSWCVCKMVRVQKGASGVCARSASACASGVLMWGASARVGRECSCGAQVLWELGCSIVDHNLNTISLKILKRLGADIAQVANACRSPRNACHMKRQRACFWCMNLNQLGHRGKFWNEVGNCCF